MPIEIQIEKQFGKTLPAAEVQRKCRAYAAEQIERQKADFKRLGVLGDWDNPYKTMDFENEADEIRALGEDHREGLCLSRPEAGQLVLRLRLRAGRSRSRVQGSDATRHRRRLFPFAEPGKVARGFRAGVAAARRRRHRHLDHDARGRSRRTRRSTCIRSSTTRSSKHRTRHCSSSPQELRRGVSHAIRPDGRRRGYAPGRKARRSALRAPARFRASRLQAHWRRSISAST